MPVVRTDGRAGGRSVYGHVITKFSRMGSLPHFFTHGAPLRASKVIYSASSCCLLNGEPEQSKRPNQKFYLAELIAVLLTGFLEKLELNISSV